MHLIWSLFNQKLNILNMNIYEYIKNTYVIRPIDESDVMLCLLGWIILSKFDKCILVEIIWHIWPINHVRVESSGISGEYWIFHVNVLMVQMANESSLLNSRSNLTNGVCRIGKKNICINHYEDISAVLKVERIIHVKRLKL